MVGVCVLVVLLATALMNSDWLDFVDEQRAGPALGRVSSISQDVRHKADQTLQWKTSRLGQKVYLNDSIFSGPNSSVSIDMVEENARVQLGENTLVYFRRIQNENLLNFDRGNLRIQIRGKMDLAASGKLTTIEGADSEIQIFSNTDSFGRTVSKIRLLKGKARIGMEGEALKKMETGVVLDLLRYKDNPTDVTPKGSITKIISLDPPTITAEFREIFLRRSPQMFVNLHIRKAPSSRLAHYAIRSWEDSRLNQSGWSAVGGNIRLNLPDGTYSIYAKSEFDEGAESSWSSPFTFRVKTLLPSAPSGRHNHLAKMKSKDIGALAKVSPHVKKAPRKLSEQKPGRQEMVLPERKVAALGSSTGSLTPLQFTKQNRLHFSVGPQETFLQYNQDVSTFGQARDKNHLQPGVNFELLYRSTHGIGSDISTQHSVGNIRLKNTSVYNKSYNLQNIDIYVVYENWGRISEKKWNLFIVPQLGFHELRRPFLLQKGVNELDLQNLVQQTWSVGFMSGLRHGRIKYIGSFHFHRPLSLDVSGANVAFRSGTYLKGSLGLFYDLGKNWSVDGAWSLFFQKNEFSLLEDERIRGNETLTASALFFRLGYGF